VKAWRQRDGTVGDNTIDGAIHRQRVNQRNTAGKAVQDAQADHRRPAGRRGRRRLSLALACDLRIMASTRS